MCPFLLSIFLEKLPVSLSLPVDCVPDRPFARHELAFVYYYTSGRSFVCLDSVLICSFVNRYLAIFNSASNMSMSSFF